MKTKLIFAILCSLLLAPLSNMAESQSTDAVLKQRLLGYWHGPRYVFLYKPDGTFRPIGREGEKSQWDIKNGTYYEDGVSCQIVTLTDKKFVYRFRGGATVSLTKMSKEEGDVFKKQTE